MQQQHQTQFFIGGRWVEPLQGKLINVIDPSTEQPFTQIAVGVAADVDRAVAAAKAALDSYSRTTRTERRDLLRRVFNSLELRKDELGHTLSREMGAPLRMAIDVHTGMCLAHVAETIRVLENFTFETVRGSSLIVKEPIGVCGLITPWNAPLNQIACKVAPALAAGCTMVLKPSELSPLNAIIFAEALEEAGVPAGVFNLVQGDGPTVGHAISAHPDVHMVSFTGSTRAGIDVARTAAATVKRVHQELGGKSANIVLHDADLQRAVSLGVGGCFRNSGQSCSAPTRMLVPHTRLDEVAHIAKAAASTFKVGPPLADDTVLGPLVSQAQFDKVQRMIQSGIDEGANLIAGGLGLPEGLERGYFVRPTVFTNVRANMTIAREEIFGPVLSIIGYLDEDEAVSIANDTPYGLAGYVQSSDRDRARRVAKRLRAGVVHINFPPWDAAVPFGGYKQSGNGREYSDYGLAEFLETKAITGYV